MLLDGEVRAADVAVWRRSDVGSYRGRFRRVPPLLAIEVAGTDEDEETLLQKASWYLSHGVKSVWLILPATREVLLVTRRRTRRLRGESQLEAPGLSGLHPTADALFRQLGVGSGAPHASSSRTTRTASFGFACSAFARACFSSA